MVLRIAACRCITAHLCYVCDAGTYTNDDEIRAQLLEANSPYFSLQKIACPKNPPIGSKLLLGILVDFDAKPGCLELMIRQA